MAVELEDLRVLTGAEAVTDAIWRLVVRWPTFKRDVVGQQMARAAESVGANIADAYERYHFGEKPQFLCYLRGSLFETKYWLNRARARALMSTYAIRDLASQLANVARQLNPFAGHIRTQRPGHKAQSSALREPRSRYELPAPSYVGGPLLTPEDIEWLQAVHDTHDSVWGLQSPITNPITYRED